MISWLLPMLDTRGLRNQRSSRLTVRFSALPAFVLFGSFVVTGSNLGGDQRCFASIVTAWKPDRFHHEEREGTRRGEIPIVVNQTRWRSPFAQRFGWPNWNRAANMKAIPDWGSNSAALLTGRCDGIRRERP